MYKLFVLAVFYFLVHQTTSDANQFNKEVFKYISPVPGSNYNSMETNIIIKFNHGIFYDEGNSPGYILVNGSKSGIHEGRTVLTGNDRTLVYYPYIPFEKDETVTVKITNIKQRDSDRILPDLEYSFRTSKTKSSRGESIKQLMNNLGQSFKFGRDVKTFNSTETRNIKKEFSLPSDFPEMWFEADNAESGVVSLAPFSYVDGQFLPNYMILLDNSGQPLFYRKTVNAVMDFKKQDNGLLTYFDMGTGQYYIMNDHLEIIDSAAMKNGYPTDLHEFVITEDDHYFMMSYDIQKIRMDTVVSGGNPDASVVGLIIQEQDENRDVVFQWRSWDHFKITDAVYNQDLTGEYIDYSHGNAIELDTDANILISSRHMDEITKISKETGEIIWRWGGKYSKNNQFTFINDSIGFSHQHDIRRLPNGNLMLFDNGNLHSPPFSRVSEYYVDETIKTASLVWEHRNNPPSFSIAMGSARRLENENTIIGWGLNTVPPSISEVTVDGTTKMTVSLPDSLINYRAFKFSWRAGTFTSDVDTVIFAKVRPGNSTESFINITNNSRNPIEINEFYLSSSVFDLNEELPIPLMPAQTKKLSLFFKPVQEGSYSSTLYLKWRDKDQMITQKVELRGDSDTTVTLVKDSGIREYILSQNFPNPFNPVTIINYSIPEESFVTLKIFDVLGSEVAILRNELLKAGSYTAEFSAANLPSGVYYYTLETNKFSSTKKMLVVK